MTEQESSPSESSAEEPKQPAPQWKPLTARQRRVAGVLVEKAKTTPDSYPMTLNAITTGCNQKSNRSPMMDLDADSVEDILDELRAMGAVAEIQGSGRVPKYRHYMYDWLGVDKYEIAVLTELLLRGDQSLGELRARASRMEKIASLDDLKNVMASLKQKGLLIELTPPGRGQSVTHALYQENELEKVRRRYADQPSQATAEAPTPFQTSAPSAASPAVQAAATPETTRPPAPMDSLAGDNLADRVSALEQVVEKLQAELQALRDAIES